ncbi:M23 family peptidase [Blastococcus sp. TF02A-30]|nr:M23 family peptidase [Blastococcus sp. TF02A-30]
MSLTSAGLLAGVLIGAGPAAAAPRDDARVAHDAVAAEVAAIAARVTEAEDNLQRMTVEAEAASGEALAAQAALDAAHQDAERAAAELAEARATVERGRDEVVEISRQAYMSGGQELGEVQLILDADGPGELLQQAATLDHLGDERSRTLAAFEADEQRQRQADRNARAAVEDRDRLAREADEKRAAADAQLAGAQADFDALAAEKTRLDEQLKAAEIRLLELQGQEDAERAWAGQQTARLAATTLSSAGGAVAPTHGRVTSCYGARWGTLHAGVDIAAPIGTPVFTPEGGVVLQAGPASGFGLAVAVQHGDGTITLYGHVNQFFVTPGQAVAAGEQIAEVGNRGQSTGPHLHFEVHRGGLYADRTNPVPWLTQRGISLGGC